MKANYINLLKKDDPMSCIWKHQGKKMGAENGRDAEGFWEDSKGNPQQALPSVKTKKNVWGL